MLDNEARKPFGVYYTPVPIVRYIVRQTLGPLLDRTAEGPAIRVLDPACGEGVFLQEAFRYLLARRAAGREPLAASERLRILATHLFGVELEPRAVEATRQALAGMVWQGVQEPFAEYQTQALGATLQTVLEANIRCGNALIGPDIFDGLQQDQRDREAVLRPLAWQQAFAAVLGGPGGGFEAVIGNPPYVNVRLLAQNQSPAIRRYLRLRYRCARHGYDLYVLFVEKAWQLLRPGGWCGLILPNKLATAGYARPCRRLLLQHTTLHQLDDLSACPVFPGAGVYPYILIWEKQPAAPGHRIAVRQAASASELSAAPTPRYVRQAELSAEGGFAFHGTLDVESRTATQPLAKRARLHSGTTGFAARRLADQLQEKADRQAGPGFEFIVSGNIDRYRIQLGNVRFMHHTYIRPVLPADAAPLTDHKRSLFGGPKLVIAGMGRRLEAALDDVGLALGVQVYAAQPMDDPCYLLALLNSRLLSYLFRIRFAAKRLAGGFLAVNKGQLAQLPIRTLDSANPRDRSRCQRIRGLVQCIHRWQQQMAAGPPDPLRRQLARHMAAADRQIDQLVYQLYRLNASEIARVEADEPRGRFPR